MDVRPRRLLGLALGALGLLVGLLVVAWIAAPKVTSYAPAPDTLHVPGMAHVTISFNRPMDQASVESRLAVDPAIPGRFTWEGSMLSFAPDQPWPAGGLVTVHLAAGARSTRSLPSLSSLTWSFKVSTPMVAYLWPAGSPADLYMRSQDGDETVRLTETAFGVYDYSITPDGAGVVYTTERSDGGTEFHRLDLTTCVNHTVYVCPEGSRCRAGVESPDGAFLAFEQYERVIEAASGAIPGPLAVMLLEVGHGASAVPVSEGHITSMPSWSPQGRLAYYDHDLRAIVIAEVPSEGDLAAVRYIPSELGAVGSFSPDGEFMVFPEIIFPEEGPEGEDEAELVQFYSHVFRAAVFAEVILDLWRASYGLVEDAFPVYSPDGEWIAFARKYLEGGRWTLGRQVWVMRADGSAARQLTDEPTFNHSALAWSPDGSTLLYMRFDESDLTQASEIWLIEANGESARRLAIGGYLPRWIP